MTDLFFKGGETITGLRARGHWPSRRLSKTRPRGSASRIAARIRWAAKPSGPRRLKLRFPLPFVPDSLGMQGAVFVDAGSLWDAERDLPETAVAGEAASSSTLPTSACPPASALSGSHRSGRFAPISPRPCSRPPTTGPNCSASAPQPTTRACFFCRLGVIADAAIPCGELRWNIRAFSSARARFPLSAMIEAAGASPHGEVDLDAEIKDVRPLDVAGEG